jgi:SAM-dependent methyltransferase
MASSSLKPDSAAGTPPAAAMTPELEHLRSVWQTLGREDPLWAVLSHADKSRGRWQREEFFATGKIEIDVQMAALGSSGFPRERAVALDFGCGAGRLTRALAGHFRKVIGLDVSSSMLATARTLNADIGNVEFRENAASTIEGVADKSVDFVYSNMTLQHIPADLAAGYVEEFFRILAPGGVAVFQFVSGPDRSLRGDFFGRVPNRWLNVLRRVAWRRGTVFEMHPLSESGLAWRLQRFHCLRILRAGDDFAAGPGWLGRRWCVANTDAGASDHRPGTMAC